jgi:hypothetical protein
MIPRERFSALVEYREETMDRTLDHPAPVESHFWQDVTYLLNAFHFLLSVGLILGGLLLPSRYLVLVVICNLVLLFRYHDYCFVSEVTELTGEWGNGCRKAAKFSGEIINLYRDYLGVDITPKTLSNTATAGFMLSSVTALLRLAVQYGIPVIADAASVFFFGWLIFLWVFYEVYNAYFYEPLPFCDGLVV